MTIGPRSLLVLTPWLPTTAARKAISNHSTDVDSRIADAGQRQRSSLLKEVQRAVQTWSDAHAAAVNKELRVCIVARVAPTAATHSHHRRLQTLHKRLDAVAATSGVVPVRASSRGRSRTDGDARSSGSGNVPPTVAPATAAAAAAAASAARALAAAASESVNDDGSSHRSVSGAGAGAGVGASEGARSEGRRSGREASTGAGGGAGGGAGVSSVPPANAEGGAGGGGGGGDSGAAPEEPPFVGAMVGVRAGSVTSGAPSTVMGGDRTTIGDAVSGLCRERCVTCTQGLTGVGCGIAACVQEPHACAATGAKVELDQLPPAPCHELQGQDCIHGACHDTRVRRYSAQ